jgi:hypothetical protein
MSLYANLNVLNSRLVFYLGILRLRVDNQAGFRPEMSTAHQLIIVQHLIDATLGDKPLLLAFLDFSKAKS